MLLQGLFVPLSSPFYRDGASYVRKLEHNVGRYSLGPAAGLIALPPRGESAALTDAEAHAALQAVSAVASEAKVLIAGVERASVHAALEVANVAASAGFDAILLSPPQDWARLVHGADARELLVFYEAVADRSPLPVVLWSDAKPPALPLPLEVVTNLAQHPNVIGLLDADLTDARLREVRSATEAVRREAVVTTIFEAVTRRMLKASAAAPATATQGLVAVESLLVGSGTASAATTAVAPAAPALKTRTREVGFQILAATPAADVIGLLQAGAAGFAPVLAACAPQACFEAYAAWKDGDLALAAERSGRLRRAEEVLERLGPTAVKAGCDFNGYYGGQPRLPRLPLTAPDRDEVERVLLELRN